MTDRIGGFEAIGRILRAALLIGGLCFFCLPLIAQRLPAEIRGYKVQRAEISIKNQTEAGAAKKKSEAFVTIGDPQVTDVSLAGITFELKAEINGLRQSGTVDFLEFQDFRVNDLPVVIKEYRDSFEFKKNQVVALPSPFKITVGARDTMRGALREINESKAEWTVTGRIFVFGRFKKSFLKFKRVVPVEINLKIKNPLKKFAA